MMQSKWFSQTIGYVIASGSVLLYAPMIFSLSKSKDAKGFSVQTWIFNILGLTTTIAYPFRKGFHLSTYLENIAICAQGCVMLSLICFYNKKFIELAVGAIAYAFLAFFLFLGPIPVNYYPLIQLLSTIMCNYSLAPQIYLNYKLKRVTWSAVTALCSLAGNVVRIFTTLQLTGDKLVLGGHVLGVFMNAIILLQKGLYRRNEALPTV